MENSTQVNGTEPQNQTSNPTSSVPENKSESSTPTSVKDTNESVKAILQKYSVKSPTERSQYTPSSYSTKPPTISYQTGIKNPSITTSEAKYKEDVSLLNRNGAPTELSIKEARHGGSTENLDTKSSQTSHLTNQINFGETIQTEKPTLIVNKAPENDQKVVSDLKKSQRLETNTYTKGNYLSTSGTHGLDERIRKSEEFEHDGSMIIHNQSGVSKCTKFTIENPEELDPGFTHNLLSPPRSGINRSPGSPLDGLREELQKGNVRIARVIIEAVENEPDANKNFLGSLGQVEDFLKTSGVMESKYKGTTSSYPKAVERLRPEDKKESLPTTSTVKIPEKTEEIKPAELPSVSPKNVTYLERPQTFASPKPSVSSNQSTTTPYQQKSYKDYLTISQYTPKSTVNYNYQTPKPQTDSQTSYTGKYQPLAKSDVISVTSKPTDSYSNVKLETEDSKPTEENKSVVEKINQQKSELINKYKQYQSSPYTQYSTYSKTTKPIEATPNKESQKLETTQKASEPQTKYEGVRVVKAEEIIIEKPQEIKNEEPQGGFIDIPLRESKSKDGSTEIEIQKHHIAQVELRNSEPTETSSKLDLVEERGPGSGDETYPLASQLGDQSKHIYMMRILAAFLISLLVVTLLTILTFGPLNVIGATFFLENEDI